MRLLVALLAFVASIEAGSRFTLEQVLSSPFPSALVSNGKGAIAWVQNSRGVRNVWYAAGPVYEGKQLTSYTEDDGQEIDQLSVSSDGAAVAFTRGDSANGRGEYPNPRHAVAGVEQTVFVVSTSGGTPREIGKGKLPAISLDAKTVAFIASGQVWSSAIDANPKPVQLIHSRGTAESLSWSPDGRCLAITSERAQHSFIEVYDAAVKTVLFLDPSVDRDANPVWSPDSKSVAFTRIATTQEAFDFGPRRAAEHPWSIRVADAATGKGRDVFSALRGTGSEYRDTDSEHQILWAASDRIVFPWERSGWLHLYSVPVSGGPTTELTPGEFEVEHVTLSDDRRSVIYSSNQNDIDRRHIWRVSVTGGTAQRLTTGPNIEWRPVAAGSDVAMFESDARVPAHAVIVTSAGMKNLAAAAPADFPSNALVDPQQVLFPAADGLTIHGQLFLPQDGKSQHPAVIFFHGGSRRQMLLGWHYMFYYHQAYAFNQYLASLGYVVLSVNYRSGIGYGLNFREAENYGATGASEYNDVVGAGLYLRSRKDVIANRIGLWGGSYGGYLTALGLARASDLFAAGVDLHGVHEWNEEIQNFVPAYDPQKRQDLARTAFASSPMAFIGTWKSPVLLIQGDDDRNVNFRQTLMLAEALRKQGVYFEQLIFPDEIHDFLVHEHWLAAYHAAEDFLGRYLMPAQTGVTK